MGCVSPTDPVTFTLVASGFATAALLACCVPVRRAVAISPIDALRAE
jgi:ABC-type lipoprotein release transport system permease subunit